MTASVRTFISCAILVCALARGSETSSNLGIEFADTVRLYEVESNTLSQFYELPWSALRSERLATLYAAWQQKLAQTDFDALSRDGKIDYLLLKGKLDHARSRLERDRERLAQIDELLPFRAPIQELEAARWRLAPLNVTAAATTISAFPDQIAKLRGRLEKGRKDGDKSEKKNDEGSAIKLPPAVARRAAHAVDEIRHTLRVWFDYHNGYQPEFGWWMRKPFEEADKSLEEFAKYLREELAGLKGKDDDPLVGEVLGADGLTSDLAHERLPYSAKDLLAIGEREFDWCEARMKETAREMGCDDWKAALAKVKNIYVAPGEQDKLVAEQAAEAIAFVKQNDLVTVPQLCEETWRITMIPPEGQKSIPYAAYGGMNMMAAYARDDMKHADKLMSMRGNNKHFTRNVTAHELIPGHHLQSFYAQRYHEYRGVFGTPFFVEGWAQYWETFLWDKGYGRLPEDRIGMLFWRMHRAARIIVSLRFHLGKMTPPEMVDFLVDRVGHERFGATSEVRRFIAGDYSPLYQCGYMIGALQLRALHKEALASGKYTERAFHDAVLHCGPIPVDLIRASLLDLPLTRDDAGHWKFDKDR